VGVAFGWIYFNEAAGMPATEMALFAAGCGISVVGISLLFFKKKRSKQAAAAAAGEAADEDASTALLAGSPAGEDAAYGAATRDSLVVNGYQAAEAAAAGAPTGAAARAATSGRAQGYGSVDGAGGVPRRDAGASRHSTRRPTLTDIASPLEPATSPVMHLRRTEGGAVAAATMDVIDAARDAFVARRARGSTAGSHKETGGGAGAHEAGVQLPATAYSSTAAGEP
jgi:hypothetical protein